MHLQVKASLLDIVLSLLSIKVNDANRATCQVSKRFWHKPASQCVVVPVQLGVCLFQQKDPHVLLRRAREKGHSSCGHAARKVVINRQLLPDSTFADLHFVDAMLGKVVGDEQLLEQSWFFGEASQGWSEPTVTKISFHDVGWANLIIKELDVMTTFLWLQEILRSLPNDLWVEGKVFFWIIDAWHDRRELNVDKAFDLILDQHLLDLKGWRAFGRKLFERLAAPL